MIDPLPRPNPSALVLVVDGESGNIHMVGPLLLEHGHEVMAANSGEDALAKLMHVQPDVILLDVMISGMTGFELCRRLHQNHRTRDIPVLFLSSATDKNFVMEALDAGAVDYVTRPFHEPELISRVELHAGRRKLHLQLAQVIREKNRLLEIVAHDLKNPLSGIQFAVSMLAEDQQLTDAHREQIVSSIGESTQRAFEIVSGLLETELIEGAKADVVKKPLSLMSHVERAIANFEQHCLRKEITIRRDGSEKDFSVVGESRLLMCCVENLVSNAIKFSSAGSTVSIQLYSEGGSGVFRIEDEGPGILEEDIPRLFGKFTRLSARPTNGEASTGLGLHIVNELVTAMDGKVSYAPGVRGGSVFLISLPLVGSSEVG